MIQYFLCDSSFLLLRLQSAEMEMIIKFSMEKDQSELHWMFTEYLIHKLQDLLSLWGEHQE